MDTKTNISGSFIRVAREQITTQEAKQYLDVNIRSVQRAVTIVVQPEAPVEHTPEVGFCGLEAGVQNGNGLLITCVRQNSPADRSGIMAGHVLLNAGGRTVTTPSDLEDVLATKRPGELLPLDLAWVGRRTVKLGYGVPR